MSDCEAPQEQPQAPSLPISQNILQDVQVGRDVIFQGDVTQHITIASTTQPEETVSERSIDELVQHVRSRLHNDIQRLHGIMPLWGVDHWVPLGEMFVDVNILEELSSSRRLELDDLWQDFCQDPSYRRFDRIGLGKEQQRISGLEVLKNNTNLMIVGKPGSGKTTYLQRVVTECNAGNLQAGKIPILIKLRDFIEDGRSLSYSFERYLKHSWQLSEVATQLVLKQGRTLVLIDGLDEVVGQDGRTIVKRIKQFAREYPQVQILVTCRTQSFTGEMDWKSLRFNFVEVADFNEQQVRTFSNHWFQSVCEEQTAVQAKVQVFLEQLFREENKPIQDLAITPILLSLTCAVFQQKQVFYSRRSKLYEEGLELLLEKWDKSREIERDEIYRNLSLDRKLELLRYLAVKKFEQSQYVLFDQVEIEEYIAKFLEIGQRDSRIVLKAIESQHGLLIERAQKMWSFSHLSFQEYLVAQYFIDDVNWSKLFNHLSSKHWHNIFLLITNMLPNPNIDSFLMAIKQNIDSWVSLSNEIQQLCILANKKAIVVKRKWGIASNDACTSSIIRAFYIQLFFFKNSSRVADCFDISQSLTNRINLSLSITYGMALDFEKTQTLDFSLDLMLYKVLNRAISNNLDLIYHLKACRSIIAECRYKKGSDDPKKSSEKSSQSKTIDILDKNIEEFIYMNEAAKETKEFFWIDVENLTDMSLDMLLDKSFTKLDGGLEKLIEELSEQVKIENWWKLNSKYWIQKLRKLMITERIIGFKLYLSDEQKYLFEQYYIANKVLISCLNDSNNVSGKVRSNIESTLLLPATQPLCTESA